MASAVKIELPCRNGYRGESGRSPLRMTARHFLGERSGVGLADGTVPRDGYASPRPFFWKKKLFPHRACGRRREDGPQGCFDAPHTRSAHRVRVATPFGARARCSLSNDFSVIGGTAQNHPGVFRGHAINIARPMG